MNKKTWVLNFFLPFLLVVLFTFLVGAVLFPPAMKENHSYNIKTVSEWTTDGQSVSLPRNFTGLPSRTPITLTTQVTPKSGDHLYFKTVYTPVKLYADDTLLFQYGGPSSYPAFLLDPPTCVTLIPLPETDRRVELRLEYLTPSQRNVATLHPVLMGSSSDIYAYLFSEMGFSLFFSFVLIALGFILCLISFILTRFEKSGVALLWLGLFSFCDGVWALGECNLTGLFVQNPSFLYVLAFLGMFTMVIPMLKFGLVLLELPKEHILNRTCLVMELSVCLSVLLQLLGKVSLSRSMYLFHILAPLALCLFAGSIVTESVRNQNPMARRFLLPVTILALFALLEVSSYYLLHLKVQKSFFFQVGVLLFLFMVSILCGYFIRDTFAMQARNRRLSYEISLMEKQIEIQKQRHRLLSETSAQIRQQRHDLKHHFAVIRSYLNSHEDEKLSLYLDTLCANIPEDPSLTLCENEAVNAVALHYLSAAGEAGIASCHIRLDIPRDTGSLAESDLCVIIGNLLENAVAACRGREDTFIRMQSRLTEEILTITMDNRCRDVKPSCGQTFPSSKPGGGTGLASIQSVAEKYRGGCRFEVKGDIFSSSVYLHCQMRF